MKTGIRLAGVLAIGCGVVINSAFAEDTNTSKLTNKDYEGIVETTPPKQIDWHKLAERPGNGCVKVYVDKDGVPTEIYVMGVGSIYATLGPVAAEQQAAVEAELSAKAIFALWIQEHISVKTVHDKKILVVTKGEQAGNAEASRSEQGEMVTITRTQVEQFAESTWRGMSLFWDERANGRYVAVWRWSATAQELAKMTEKLTHDENVKNSSNNSSTNATVKDLEGMFR